MKKYENFCSALQNLSATGSPKMILKTAYKAGMIEDEELWLQGLIARNNVAHVGVILSH